MSTSAIACQGRSSSGGPGTELPANTSGARSPLSISLLGRPRFTVDQEVVFDNLPGRSAELLCYLLLHPDHSHPREGLADLLWGEHCTTAQSKKYLRQTLWQLQTALHDVSEGTGLLNADSDWIWLNAEGLRLDVALFEKAYTCVREARGRALDDGEVEALIRAVVLYRGELLEGWYQEWCLCERERLRQLYLLMLDRLMDEHERRGQAEAGITFGERGIAADPFRERTYQGLMRLHLALGDRTGALRHYNRCLAALRDEFGVPPSAYTQALFDQAREGGAASDGALPLEEGKRNGGGRPSEVALRYDRVLRLQRRLRVLQEEIEREVEGLGEAVRGLLR